MTRNKVEASALSRWMSKGKSIKRPPDVAKAGNNIEQPEHAPARTRKKSERTARVEIRMTREERRLLDLYSVQEEVSVSEIFSRMLALYRRTHGKFEVRHEPEETSE